VCLLPDTSLCCVLRLAAEYHELFEKKQKRKIPQDEAARPTPFVAAPSVGGVKIAVPLPAGPSRKKTKWDTAPIRP
jgi:hypothetical protein